MKFTPQRVKFLHSIDGVNYSLDFFFREYYHIFRMYFVIFTYDQKLHKLYVYRK